MKNNKSFLTLKLYNMKIKKTLEPQNPKNQQGFQIV